MLRRTQPFLVGLAALVLGLSAGPLMPAHAMFTTCRSDPVVTLSNGAVIDVQAGISDSASDVQSITYVVHVPAGLSVVSVVNTDSILGLVEKVTVYADDTANTYDTTTTVRTGASNVGVTASTTVVSALGLTLGAVSTSGKSGQGLSLHVASLL